MRRLTVVGALLLLSASLGRGQTLYQVYRVRQGDTVEKVAGQFKMTPEEVRSLNPFLQTGSLNPNELITVMVRPERSDLGAAGAVERAGAGANGVAESPSVAGGARWIDPAGETAPQEMGQPRPAVRPEPAAEPVETPAPVTTREFAGHGSAGRLGVVTADNSPIVRQPEAGAAILYACPKNTRLAVTRQVGEWYAVLMVDRSTGWIAARAVNLTETNLVANDQAPTSAAGNRILQEAYRYLGVPYVWGGNGFSGIDCSGLVQRAYAKVGISLPRVSRDQFLHGTSVAWDKLQPGDRLYFASNGSRIDHTGLYLGGGQFIHASGRHQAVVVSSLFDPRYWSIYVGAKR